MRTEHTIRDYRIVVPGKAESFRSPRAKAYKRLIRQIAGQTLPVAKPTTEMEIQLHYFHTSIRRFDMDNVSKCVMDALSGVAYIDDQQIARQSSQAYDLRYPLDMPDAIVDLIKPLRHFDDYLFIRLKVTLAGLSREKRFSWYGA